MALSDHIEELAKKHGALSYRNRADTQHPAYGFTPAQLLGLLAEVRKEDEALISDILAALEYHAEQTRPIRSTTVAIETARERLGRGR